MPQETSSDNSTAGLPFEPSEKTFFTEIAKARGLNQRHFAITVARSPAEVYAFMIDRQRLGRVMKGVDRVDPITDIESRWTAHHKLTESFEWTVLIDARTPGERIRWSASCDDSRARIDGEVELARASGKLGTVVSLTLEHTTTGGKVAEWIAFIGGEDPETLARINLKRLKAYLETGEIPTTEGQPSGRDEDLMVQPH